jgi:dolichol-phosphate mannosyltransferase
MDGNRGLDRPASLSLVLPAYNEEAGIRQAIAEADAALAGLGGEYEVLVVDDGSRDGTARAVSESARTYPRVRLLRHPENRGYGAALRTGFEAARFDLVAFTDADCQFDLSELVSLVRRARQASLVVGYRVDRRDPWHRRFFSWGYNVLVRSLLGTGVRDCDCALKVFRRQALAGLLPETSGYFVNTEMLTKARQHGYRVAEVGVRHRPRLRGVSKVSLGDIPRTLRTLLPFWWSRVLFPHQPEAQARERSIPRSRFGLVGARTLDVGLWTLLLAAAVLFFSRLGCPLLEPDEARYAEIPRQMLSEGRFVVPVMHGQAYYHKPPLLYWLVMGSYQLFGVHDWAARLVSCGAGFLGVLVTYLWGRRVLSARAALAGAFILCLSVRFVYLGRMLTMDSLLCLWVVAAWAAAHTAVRRPLLRWRWWLLSAGACGLGMLTKGPVALALVAVPIWAYQALDARSARARRRSWLAYLAVAAAVACPWYLAVALSDPQFVREFLWTHNVRRYLAPLDHEEPFWFYLPSLFLGMLPWTLLLPALVRFLFRRSAAAARQRPAELGVFLLASLWCVLFYSAGGCKRPGYILPAIPPLALALGCFLDVKFLRTRARLLSRCRIQPSAFLHPLERWAYRGTLLVLAVGAAGSVAAIVAGLHKPSRGLLLAAAALAGFAWVLRHGRTRASWALCGTATFALLFAGAQQVLPGYARKFSLRAQVHAQRDWLRDSQVPVVCYPHRWDSVSFYLGRNDVRGYGPDRRQQLIADLHERPETVVFVKSDRHLAEFQDALPEWLEFIPRGRQGAVTAGLVRRRLLVADRQN